MITIRQPALALHSCDVPGYLYKMSTTWKMPSAAKPSSVLYWINLAIDQSPELALANVVINCHGKPGRLYIGGNDSAPMKLSDVGLFAKLKARDIGTLWLVGCNVATGLVGEAFCKHLAVAVGCDVVAANDYQFVERRYEANKAHGFGTIDDFEGTAYMFSPAGSKSLLSIHDPLAEGYS